MIAGLKDPRKGSRRDLAEEEEGAGPEQGEAQRMCEPEQVFPRAQIDAAAIAAAKDGIAKKA